MRATIYVIYPDGYRLEMEAPAREDSDRQVLAIETDSEGEFRRRATEFFTKNTPGARVEFGPIAESWGK